MSEITGIARFTFHPGQAAEFKRLSEQCMQIVRAKDPGTLQYDIYLDDDETRAVVIERYASLEALMAHLANIGDDLMAQIMATADVEGETLGIPTPELRAGMQAAGVALLSPYLSMTGD